MTFRAKDLADWEEYYSERAAIYEYLGELSRAEAERLARRDAGEKPKPLRGHRHTK